jgi:hypothetical protein
MTPRKTIRSSIVDLFGLFAGPFIVVYAIILLCACTLPGFPDLPRSKAIAEKSSSELHYLHKRTKFMILPDCFYKRWTRSPEEDGIDAYVYRSDDFEFPMSRLPRNGMDFHRDGTYVGYESSPSDQSKALPGRWQIRENGVIEISLKSSSMTKCILIETCTDSLLKVKEYPC